MSKLNSELRFSSLLFLYDVSRRLKKHVIYIKLFHETSTHLETESMKRTFLQLWVLAWKNLLLQMRHPWVTLIELLIPAFLSAMLLIGRVQVEPTKIANITTWDEFEVGNYRFRGE